MQLRIKRNVSVKVLYRWLVQQTQAYLAMLAGDTESDSAAERRLVARVDTGIDRAFYNSRAKADLRERWSCGWHSHPARVHVNGLAAADRERLAQRAERAVRLAVLADLLLVVAHWGHLETLAEGHEVTVPELPALPEVTR